MPDISIKPLRGIVTDVNPLVAPPGSMAAATNVVFVKSGGLGPIHGVSTLASLGDGANVRRVIDFGTHLLVAWENNSGTLFTRWVKVSDGTITTAQLPSSTDPTYETGRINGFKYRDRCYWTSKQGLICADTVSDTTLRKSGLPAPLYAQVAGSGDRCNVCAVFRRDFADNSFMRSAPSVVTQYSLCSTLQNWVVRWVAGLEMVAGDKVEVYRTKGTTGLTPGTTFYLCGTHTITSAEITSRSASFSTHTPDAGLGEALYTNAGQQGALHGHFPPPHLTDVVMHRGSVLGVAERGAHSLALRVPGRYGNLSTDDERTYGIGKRIITGQIVTGSPNITGVSASHSLGIVAGQRVSHADFPSTTLVVSIAAGTIVTDTNATSDSFGGAPATDIVIYDVLNNGGTKYDCEQWYASTGTTSLLYQLWVNGQTNAVTLSQPVSHDQATNDGLDMVFALPWAGSENIARQFLATNGANWDPQLSWSVNTPTTVQSHKNRIAYSEPNLPESWPLLNYFYLGEGDIVRLLHIGDAVYAFSTDRKIYRISGAGRSWRADQVADGFLPVASMAAASNGLAGYVWTDAGLLRITEGGISIVSANRVNNALASSHHDNLDATTPWTWDATIAADRYNRRIFLFDGSLVWLFDEDEGEFTRYQPPATFSSSDFAYSEQLHSMCYGAKSGDAVIIRRFVAPDSTTREASVTLAPNRTDLGMPAVTKTWDGVVLGFYFETIGAQTFSFTAYGDDDAGGQSVSAVSLAVTPVSGEGRNVPVPIGLAAAMITQARFQLTAATNIAWLLEDIVYRFTPRVDRVARNEP